MKQLTNSLSSIKHLFGKILFSSQLVVIGGALPVLYCIGVSHNIKLKNKTVIIRTNKGKTIVESAGADNKTIQYYSLPNGK